MKAPLRGISSLSDWLLTDYGDRFDEEGKELVNMLINRVRKMYSLIDGILQYSQVGSIKEEQQQVNLNDVVLDVVEMLALPESVQIEIKNTLPIVDCETTRIKQVFQNLLSNAIKFMDKPQGQIIIDCAEKNSYWQLSIADNGPGIEEKYFHMAVKFG